jgi:hypothetical protein
MMMCLLPYWLLDLQHSGSNIWSIPSTSTDQCSHPLQYCCSDVGITVTDVVIRCSSCYCCLHSGTAGAQNTLSSYEHCNPEREIFPSHGRHDWVIDRAQSFPVGRQHTSVDQWRRQGNFCTGLQLLHQLQAGKQIEEYGRLARGMWYQGCMQEEKVVIYTKFCISFQSQ